MIHLSLSGRIAEQHDVKDQAALGFADLAALAARLGYRGLCLRPSQLTADASDEMLDEMRAILNRHGLVASMVTLHVNIARQGGAAEAAASLRTIGPDLRVARRLGAPLVRVALRQEADIPWAQRAADEAHEQGLRLAHLTHTNSPFETIDDCLSMLRRIDRPNFGLVVEPANLVMCGQDYGPAALGPLGPHITNVYIQNVRLTPDGPLTIGTRRGPVRYDLLRVDDPAGIDLPRFVAALKAVDYQGFVTVHQPAVAGITTAELAHQVYEVLAPLLA